MKRKIYFLYLFLMVVVFANAQQVNTPPAGPPQPGQLITNIGVHDPVMFQQDDTYYCFCTGNGISMFSSKNMITWTVEKPVFATAPQWAKDSIKGFRGNSLWAPDISYNKKNKLYYLYYSCSAFGKNTSAIGVATNKTLHTDDPNYKWEDHGLIIQSIPGKTNWNAIDPNLILDDNGTPWLVFGSFWDGLKIVKLTADQFKPAEPLDNIPTVASRKKDPAVTGNLPSVGNNPVDAGGNAIEGAFVFKKNGYYYLFASIDYCCKGVNSTYKMIVARSKDVKGPYMDKAGLPMAHGGGTIVLQGDSLWNGVGHNAVCTFNKTDYLIFHGYDAKDRGRSKLRIEKMTWDKDKWPVVVVEYPFMVKPRT
jgi:arabinan endo-1,5-alpha-L-arabinosidase